MDELIHHGVKGMKWGRKKARPIASNVSKTKHKALTRTPSKSKKNVKTGKKKSNRVLQKVGKTTVKGVGKTAKLGFSMAQSLYNISDLGVENRKMTNYMNTASQMSPEYRRRFMYD